MVRELDGLAKSSEGSIQVAPLSCALFTKPNKESCERSKLKRAWAPVQGKACNVAKSGDVGALANYAQDTLGTVDLWQALPHDLQFAIDTLATLP